MKRKHVKLEYDPDADAAYLTLDTGRVVESEQVRPGLIVDFGSDDRVVGVEILRFSRRFQSKAQSGTSRNRARTPRTPAA